MFLNDGQGRVSLPLLVSEIQDPVAVLDDLPAPADFLHRDLGGIKGYTIFGHSRFSFWFDMPSPWVAHRFWLRRSSELCAPRL